MKQLVLLGPNSVEFMAVRLIGESSKHALANRLNISDIDSGNWLNKYIKKKESIDYISNRVKKKKFYLKYISCAIWQWNNMKMYSLKNDLKMILSL